MPAFFIGEDFMKIEILSVGCPRCNELLNTVEQMVKELGIDGQVIKVEDMKTFCKYGVFMLPALVVDGEVKVAGKVPKESELACWLTSPRLV